jgi:hypothetical protein
MKKQHNPYAGQTDFAGCAIEKDEIRHDGLHQLLFCAKHLQRSARILPAKTPAVCSKPNAKCPMRITLSLCAHVSRLNLEAETG